MHCWARHLFIGTIVVLGVGQMIAACGQKGDLYLPEKESVRQASPAATTEVPPPTNPKAQRGQ